MQQQPCSSHNNTGRNTLSFWTSSACMSEAHSSTVSAVSNAAVMHEINEPSGPLRCWSNIKGGCKTRKRWNLLVCSCCHVAVHCMDHGSFDCLILPADDCVL